MDATELDAMIAIWSLWVFHSSGSSGKEWSYVFIARKNYNYGYTAYIERRISKTQEMQWDVLMFPCSAKPMKKCLHKSKATKYSAPLGTKLWVTPPGEQAGPAVVTAKSGGNLHWVLEEAASVGAITAEACSTVPPEFFLYSVWWSGQT